LPTTPVLPPPPNPNTATDWQRTLRSQGLGRRATHCELCKAYYVIPNGSSDSNRASLPRQLALAARYALADAVRANCWPVVALRLWKGYVMASGVVS